jgi:hypothetical protein
MTLLVEAPTEVDDTLRPWLTAHAGLRAVDVVRRLPDAIPGGVRAVVRVGDPRCSPARALPAPVLQSGGRLVPAGWIPADESLPAFVRAAAQVLHRTESAPVALLGQRSRRYARLAERFEANLEPDLVVRWTAERLTREDMLAALGTGLGLGVYLGHGRPTGWAAYRGIRSAQLLESDHRGPGLPLGGLVSVTCWTASRWRTRRSFAEAAVASGRAVAAIGSTRPVEHLASMRLVLALATAVSSLRVRTVGDMLVNMALSIGPDAVDLRLVGDPCAPLAGEPGAAARARAVFAPALDDPLDSRALPLSRPAVDLVG